MSVLVMGAYAAEMRVRIEFPTEFTVIQRKYPSGGPMRIRGTAKGEVMPGKIEARFNGGKWQIVDAAPKGGQFFGTITGKTGQGPLEVRCTALPDAVATVSNISLGDVFVIAGQSNADGRGGHMVTLNADNPTIGSKFRAGAWSKGDDPSDSAGKHASPWPIVLNTLIPEEKLPMGFIQTAVGSTVVKQWRKSGSMFSQMKKKVALATEGTMQIKAVLYYQGENDITHHNKLTVLGDYAAYKKNLLAMAEEMHVLFKAPIFIGQITNLGSLRERNDGIRQAQQESWTLQDHILPGAITYDILPTDGVHYRDAANMKAFAQRWAYAIDDALYRRKSRDVPELLEVRQLPGNRLRIRYDCKLAISSWDGKVSDLPRGFRLVQDDGQILGDADVLSCTLKRKTVTLQFRKSFSGNSDYWYGSGADGQGKAVLRNARTGQPVPLVFAHRLR